ncbi:MAG: hypothetical protein JW812_00250 [Alphaproteobacteria bacterium]|nr:hypothetical protein [Alphaproteobacteria bacterium]
MSYYQKTPLFLTVSFMLLASASFAKTSCEGRTTSKPPVVVFKINYGQPNYKDVTSDFISEKSKSTHARGLTEARFQMTYDVKVRAENNCLFLDTLTVLYGYADLDIYITNQYEKSSCEYNQILSHENHHIFVHQDALRQYSTRFGETIKRVATAIPPEYIKIGVKNADFQINKMISRLKNDRDLSRLEAEFNTQREKQNADLDQRENYEKITKRCKNW